MYVKKCMDNLEPHLQRSKNIQSILVYPKEGMGIKPIIFSQESMLRCFMITVS